MAGFAVLSFGDYFLVHAVVIARQLNLRICNRCGKVNGCRPCLCRLSCQKLRSTDTRAYGFGVSHV